MCLFLILLAASPRIAGVFWWIFDSDRWSHAFNSWIWPVLGLILLPWTTIMWVAVAPTGNPEGADWFWLALGVFLDLLSHASDGYGARSRYSSTNY